MTRKNLDDLFLEAADLPPSEVPGFLDRHCGDDAKLRASLEELLAADAAAQGKEFLESALFANKVAAIEQQASQEASTSNYGPDESRFQILRAHEQGGLGEVLIAFDHQLGREVAIKQIKPKWRDHTEARQRFLQEAEVTGRLEHPGVVPVYAMGSWQDGRHYYAMRFIEGETLKQKIDKYHSSRLETGDTRASQLQFRQLLGALIDVCNTMNYAHSKRILHRDLKPSNVMVGPYGETLIVDWGLAKQMDLPDDESMTAAFLQDRSTGTGSTPTQVGGAVGTPQYMSPEQAGGRTDEVGRCTDIYLLGGILYQILTNRPPHREESLSNLLTKVSQGHFTSPRSIDADISKPLEAICCKAMNAGTSRRYRSAAEMADDIERWLADEPVSVHRDEFAVRASRWIRRHRTLAVSGAVAAGLITFGTVAGSLFWNAQRTRQFEIQQERNAKEAQLQNERQQRLSERTTAARIAETFADAEIRVNRFSSASSFLKSAIDAIGDEASLESDRQRVIAKSERINRLVQFYEQADYAHQQNYLSRDTSGVMACKAALDAAGVWDQVDWWAHLPDDDLNALQREQLRERVYQQLLSLDGLLIKAIGTRLSGNRQLSSSTSFLTILRRFLRTDAGKDEARAAMLVGERIRNYRPAEAESWFTGMANFRLGDGPRQKASELGPPRNASDAHNLGVLSLIASLDESFRFFFGGYLDEDDLQVSHDLFAHSCSLRPDNYWTLLAFAHSQALLAQRDGADSSTPARNRYAVAIQTLGRCIALDPNNAFGYADRSAVYRMQADVIRQDNSLDERERKARETELLRLSLSDIERASQMNSDQPWIHWHHGLSLVAVEQYDQAIEHFLAAATDGYLLSQTDDSMLIQFDDLHGREESGDSLAELGKQTPDDGQIFAVLAAIRLNQNRIDEAAAAVQRAKELGSTDPYWIAVSDVVDGMILLRQKSLSEAEQSFIKATKVFSRSWNQASGIATWLRFGMGTCAEAKGDLASALEHYRQAERVCANNPHRATCFLAQARNLGLAHRFDAAKDAVTSARRVEPACDLLLVARPLIEHYRDRRQANADEEELGGIEELIRWIGQLPRASTLDFDREDHDVEFNLALLNGDFELGMAAYWFDPSGASWFNQDGDHSVGEVTTEHTRNGQYSLHIIGDPKTVQNASETNAWERAHGRTGQDFPVQPGNRYRVSAWVRSENLADDSLWLVTSIDSRIQTPDAVQTRDSRKPESKTNKVAASSAPANSAPANSAPANSASASRVPAIKVFGGSYEWTRFEGEFQVEIDEELKVSPDEMMSCRLEVISAGPGQAWIDDLQVVKVTDDG